MSTKKQSKAPAQAGTVVYCGPTIPGVAKQYTFFQGGIPAALSAAADRLPALGGLVVPLDQLPEAMRQLREKQGPIYALFRKVQGSK